MSYYLTQTGVQLLSPQTYHHMHGGYYEVYDIRMSMYLDDSQIYIPIYIGQKKLPIVYNYFMSDNEKLLIGTNI